MLYLKLIPYLLIALLFAAFVYRGQKIDTLNAQLATATASVQQLQSAVNDQNTAFDKLKHDASERLIANTALIVEANRVRNQAIFKSQQLLAMQAPQGVNKCDAANSIIDGEIK